MHRRVAEILLIALLLAGCDIYGSTMKAMLHRPEHNVDLRNHLKVQAERLSKHAPPTTWQTTVKHPEVDDMVVLSEHQVLVGSIEIAPDFKGSPFLFPTYGPYVLYDTQTGQEIWRFERIPDYDYSYSVLLTEPVILIHRSGPKGTTYTALDLATGRVLWSKETTSEDARAINLEHQILVIAADGTETGLIAMDLMKGTVLWTDRSKNAGKGRLPTLLTRGDQLVVMERALTRRSLRNGQVTWSVPDVGPVASSSLPLEIGDAILLPSAEGKICLVEGSGGVAWQVSLSGQPRALTSSDQMVYVEVASLDGSSSRLVSFSLPDGRKLWERTLPGPVYSSLQVTGSALVFTLQNSFEIWGARLGKTLHSVKSPSSLDNRLPDQLVIHPDYVVIAAETAIGAFRLEDGQTLWLHMLKGATEGSYSTIARRLQDAQRPPPGGIESAAQSLSATIGANMAFQNFADLQHRNNIKMIQQQLADTYQRTESAMRSGSRAQRLEAMSERALASNMASVRSRVAGAMDRMTNNINMMVGAWTQGMAIGIAIAEQASRVRDLRWFQAKVVISKQAHQNTIQRNFFIRPIVLKRGSGLMIVDMSSGTWVEVPTSPSEEGQVDKLYWNSQFAVMSVDGSRIITKGIGLDPTKWETDDRGYFATTVLRSILAYDVKKLTFKAPATYEGQSIARD